MGLVIVDSATPSQQMGVDATPRAGRVILYGPDGNPISLQDRKSAAITPGSTYGLPNIAADYKTPVLLRARADGSLIAGDQMLWLYDRAEGAAVDTNKWIQTTTTMTITQAGGVITFNAGNSFATTVGAMHTSHRFLPFPNRTALIFRQRGADSAHFTNNLIERGFASPASATNASIVNGAVWRKDGTGQYVPVISINGAEVLGTPISNATFVASVPAGQYAVFEIVLFNNHALFTIYTTAGAVLTFQAIDFPSNATSFQQTHLQAMVRTYNAAATGTAVQTIQDDISIWLSDYQPNKSYREQLAGQNGNLVSPTAYTQLANYANSAAPASAALSNTAAGYTTLGGQWQFAAVAGAETDYALFAFTVPSPYTFYITDVCISTINTVVAVATTATILQWSLAVNSSAVSLATAAPYTPMRTTLGLQGFAVGAAVGAAATDVVRAFQTPIPCFPGRFLHLILKMPVATATATEIFRGTAQINGYFE